MADTLPTVFILDDEPHLCRLYREILELEGFHVLSANTGDEALELLTTEELPPLFLVDACLPQMESYEFIEALKAKFPDAVRSRFVGFSCAPFGSRLTAQIEATADTCWEKPADINVFISRVQQEWQIAKSRLQASSSKEIQG